MPERETKRCGICLQEKPVEFFYWKIKAKNLRQAKCKACTKKYNRKHYLNHRDEYIARAAERKKGQRGYQKEEYQTLRRYK